MIGLDTNVLVRYIVQDDRNQARAATRLIETRCSADQPGFVSLLVLAELVWVLERAYGYARADVCAVIAALLATAEIRVESSQLARSALQSFRAGPADFADYLIGALHAARGCETTFTFDKRAAKSGLHSLIA
jgi:predicted nucleic-acid-binding protein